MAGVIIPREIRHNWNASRDPYASVVTRLATILKARYGTKVTTKSPQRKAFRFRLSMPGFVMPVLVQSS